MFQLWNKHYQRSATVQLSIGLSFCIVDKFMEHISSMHEFSAINHIFICKICYQYQHFDPESGGSMLCRNIDTYLPNYIASHRR
jgi:hypothetical protein